MLINLKKKAENLKKIILLINRKKPVPLSIPDLDENDIFVVSKEIRENNVALGNCIKKFENQISKITGSKNIILVSNGTLGLFATLISEKIHSNHEILVPTLNYIASTNAILACKGIPHFVDSSKDDLGVDFKKLDDYLKKITTIKKNFTINKKTKRTIKAIMITHVFGHPNNMTEAIKICKKYKLKLIEDASEALGSTYKNKHVGTYGDYGVISFNGNKIITSGGGGAIFVKKKSDFLKLKKIIDNGKKFDKFNFLHESFGLNLRLPNLNASLGYSQILKLKKKISQRRKLYKIYSKYSQKGFNIMNEPTHAKSNFWLQTIKLNNQKEKNYLLNFLYNNKIQARSIWKPNHLFSHLKKFPKMNLDNSLKIYNTTINIPSSLNVK